MWLFLNRLYGQIVDQQNDKLYENSCLYIYNNCFYYYIIIVIFFFCIKVFFLSWTDEPHSFQYTLQCFPQIYFQTFSQRQKTLVSIVFYNTNPNSCDRIEASKENRTERTVRRLEWKFQTPFLFWQKGRIHHGRSDAGTPDFRSNGALEKGEISGNSFAAFFQSVRTCEPSSNAIWNAYLSHLAAAIRNVNTVIFQFTAISEYWRFRN